jgi:hypothetical protein
VSAALNRKVTITLKAAPWVEDEQQEFEDLLAQIRHGLKYSPYEWEVVDEAL